MRLFRTLVTKKSLRRFLLLFDFLWIGFATCLAQGLRTNSIWDSFRHGSISIWLLLPLVCIALWTVAARKLSLDDLQSLSKLSFTFSRVTIGVFLLMPLAMGVAFMARTMYSRLMFLYLGCLLVLGFTGIRLALRQIVLRFRQYFVLRTVIIGSGRIACELAAKFSSHPELLRDLVAFIHPANREGPNFASAQCSRSVSALSSARILDLLNQNDVGEVILASSEAGSPQVHQLIWQCRQNHIEVSVIPHSYDLYSSQARILDLDGLPLVKVESRVPQRLDLFMKRFCDLLLVIPMIVLSVPVMLAIALICYFRGRRAIIAETRCGKNGATFGMLRFNIPRHATGLGAFDALLDRMSLTELPQLWNVVRGNMSLVGPRPENTERVQNYSDWQRQRLCMKPGITGLAQVEGLRDEHSSDEKSRYDLQYIHNWSPLVDLSLIIQTIWTLCSRIKRTKDASTGRGSGAGTTTISLGANLVGGADVNRA
jgi:lipopolysaccharide/colanic/teichoic acid biosynthesis glycosyltransferase